MSSSSSSSSSSRHGIKEVKEMKKLPNSDQALATLNRLQAHVRPLCISRGYSVASLNEFYPTQKGLLGMNVNRTRILIRLREPSAEDRFYSWDFVLGTLIHELTHMEISEHSAAFYKLMDELHDEVEKLQKNGAATQGMSDNYNTLGGKINKDKAAAEAGKAAIKRFDQQVVGSVNILGGARKKPPTKEELRRLAADAAERRLNDNKWCPNEEAKKGPTKGSNDKTILQIQCPLCEVFNDSTLDKCRVCDSILTKTSSSSSSSSASATTSNSKQLEKKRRSNEEVVDLVNSPPPHKLTCLPCSNPPPQAHQSHQPQWGCASCTFLNEDYDDKCAMCNSGKIGI